MTSARQQLLDMVVEPDAYNRPPRELRPLQALAHGLAEVLALEQLHHHEEGAVGELAEVADLDDVAALEEVGRLRLADEALEHPVGALDAGAQHLHGGELADHHVAAGVHGARDLQ